MQEARGSFNGYFRSPEGNKDQFTLRQDDNQNDQEFIQRVNGFVSMLAASGWVPWYAEQVERGAGNNSDPTNGHDPAPPNELSFQVESIKLAAGGEHPRWVIKGGNFKKYGVTCWPEVLEAAGIASKLDPLKDNPPSETWTAHYTERQNDEGRWVPDKVTKLERMAA